MKTFYEILGISENSTLDEIENAYNSLKNKYLNSTIELEKKEELLKKLDMIYNILSDSNKKRSYDLDLANMRNNEIMSNLQKNTNSYNEEIKKQEEIKKREEEEKRLQEEKIKEAEEQKRLEKIKEEKLKFVKAEIEKQIDTQKKQLEIEQKKRKKLQDAQKAEYKKYLRSMGVEIKEPFSIKKLFRVLISTIIVVCVIIAIFQIPIVKNSVLNNEGIKLFIEIFSK